MAQELYTVEINGFSFQTPPSKLLGSILFPTIPHLKYMSVKNIIHTLRTALELCSDSGCMHSKFVKQTENLSDMLDNIPTRLKSNPEKTHLSLMNFIVETVMHCEDLAKLHGFFLVEVGARKKVTTVVGVC